jgi:hypothetical protein
MQKRVSSAVARPATVTGLAFSQEARALSSAKFSAVAEGGGIPLAGSRVLVRDSRVFVPRKRGADDDQTLGKSPKQIPSSVASNARPNGKQ